MPVQRIALRKGKSIDHRRAIAESVQNALAECFDVEPDNLFAIVDEFDPEAMVYPKGYRNYRYSDDLVLVWLFASVGRSREKKAQLFAAIVHNLGIRPGLRPDDVIIHIIDTPDDNWSLGGGEPL